LALNTSNVPGSTSGGPSISIVHVVRDVCALTTEANASNKTMKRIWIALTIDAIYGVDSGL